MLYSAHICSLDYLFHFVSPNKCSFPSYFGFLHTSFIPSECCVFLSSFHPLPGSPSFLPEEPPYQKVSHCISFCRGSLQSVIPNLLSSFAVYRPYNLKLNIYTSIPIIRPYNFSRLSLIAVSKSSIPWFDLRLYLTRTNPGSQIPLSALLLTLKSFFMVRCLHANRSYWFLTVPYFRINRQVFLVAYISGSKFQYL